MDYSHRTGEHGKLKRNESTNAQQRLYVMHFGTLRIAKPSYTKLKRLYTQILIF